MCIILPVDHIPCAHTVPIFQHCTDAPRSRINGIELCSHNRQHPRPILTKRLCFNCGGPRFFARRGGIAERGVGSHGVFDYEKERQAEIEKAEHSDPDDSGYHSDVIHEEDSNEFPLSPRAPRVRVNRWGRERKRSSSSHRSPSRKPSWRPNLKRELSGTDDTSPFHRRPSIDSMVSKFEDDVRKARSSQWLMEENTPLQRAMAPIIKRPQPPKRKNSTLLHPSSPPTEITTDLQSARSFPFPAMAPPATPPSRPVFRRKGSTLLHPSSPPVDTTENLQNAKGFPFPMRLPTPTTPGSTSLPLRRPALPPRKGSTLLHPSPPLSSSPEKRLPSSPFCFPVLSKSSPAQSKRNKRRGSVIHSCLSDADDSDWEEPLHSSHSDIEYDSDDHDAEGDTESFEDHDSPWDNMEVEQNKDMAEEMILAQTTRIASACRISFHPGQLRVRQNV